jgi:transcriptional regulator with XRE-family HTH domain
MIEINDSDMKTMDKNVGKRIRIRRIEKGLTQQSLANTIGLSYQQVQKYETGSNRVSAGRLFFIAKILEVPVSYFYQEISPELNQQLHDRAKRRDRMQDLEGLPIQLKSALSNLISVLRASK